MTVDLERRYTAEPYPSKENVERFAPPYYPERFTEEEKSYLGPFVTNFDKPVYIIQHLPEEVIGAVSAKESRAKEGLRRVLLKEYLWPIAHPEMVEGWGTASDEEKQKAVETRDKFLVLINFLNTHGGIEYVVNIQRSRHFFDMWLVDFNDDSVAEDGGVHLFVEGLSNIATKEIEDKRVGISPMEKSTRYVSFAEKRPDGKYKYVIPGEIKGTSLELEYVAAMDKLMGTYADLYPDYLEYIKNLYPRGNDESEDSFNKSRRSKVFDDLRGLLPFSTQADLALYGNCRAFEDLVNRLLYHPIGELRYWGQEMLAELKKVVPSMVRRPETSRGAELQIYRTNIKNLREEMSRELLHGVTRGRDEKWAHLVSYTPDAEVEILSAFLFSGNHDLSFAEVREKITGLSSEERCQLIAKILKERTFGKDVPSREEDRFRKVSRSFENAHYLLELWARGGDYRDLQRHREDTQERQRFTTKWGWDLEREVLEFSRLPEILDALRGADRVYKKLAGFSPDIAQYAVAFDFIQHWYMNLSAREIYWMGELRTGRQARPHYKQVVLQIVDEVARVSPGVFQGIMIDRNDYRLARRESEKKIDAKKAKLKQGI